MNNIRYDGIVGIIEQPAYVHFSEYWSGEGLDFTIGDDKNISLSGEEITAVVIAAYVSGYIDLDSIKQTGELMKIESQKRLKSIETFRESFTSGF